MLLSLHVQHPTFHTPTSHQLKSKTSMRSLVGSLMLLAQGPLDTALVAPRDTALVAPRDTALVAPRDTALVAPRDTALVAPRDTALVALVICQCLHLVQGIKIHGFDILRILSDPFHNQFQIQPVHVLQ